MPFPAQPQRTFTRANIEAIKPSTMGVYGLYRHDAWIYIGRGDIRTELLRYFNGENPLIAKEGPTHFVDMITSDHVNVERQLIRELGPICNQKIG